MERSPVAIVTAAGKGIGAAIARRLSADGYRLVLMSSSGGAERLAEDETIARIPAGRYGSVDELTATVAFLLSPDAAYLTGQNIRVDGGLTRSV